MTHREKVIVSAHTGILMCDFSDVHEYIEEILGRPVQTIELACKTTWDEIKEASKSDFIAICEAEDPSKDDQFGISEQLPESSTDLKPCPFCGSVLKYDEYVALTLPGKPIMRLWAHPPGKCILSGLEISKEDHEAWNRRTSNERPLCEMQDKKILP